MSCMLCTVFPVMSSSGSLRDGEGTDPVNWLDVGEVLEHLNTIASFSAVEDWLETQGSEAVGVATVAKSTPSYCSPLNIFEQLQISRLGEQTTLAYSTIGQMSTVYSCLTVLGSGEGL
jgi:hypothetical protein